MSEERRGGLQVRKAEVKIQSLRSLRLCGLGAHTKTPKQNEQTPLYTFNDTTIDLKRAAQSSGFLKSSKIG